MKKRLISAIAAMALLLSLLPAVSLPAGAAGETGMRVTSIQAVRENGEAYRDYAFTYNDDGRMTLSSYTQYGEYSHTRDTAFKYDAALRLISRVTYDPHTPGVNTGETYTYNEEGQLVRTESWEGGATQTVHEYDSAGRRIRSTATSDPGVSVTQYSYDASGVCTGTTVTHSQTGSSNTWQETTRYHYDARGRLIQTDFTGAVTATTTYDYSYGPFVICCYSEDSGFSSVTVALRDDSGNTLVTFPFTRPEYHADSNGCLTEVVDTCTIGTAVEKVTYRFSYEAAPNREEAENASPYQSPKWNDAYYDYIVEDRRSAGNTEGWEYVEYRLVYLDGDEIPELWITYQNWAAGCRLVSYQNGSLTEQLLGSGELTYVSGENCFLHTYGHMGNFFDTVYTLRDRVLVTVAEGRREATVNQDGTQNLENMNYYWNEAQVEEEIYADRIAQYIDPSEASTSSDRFAYSYTEILEYLSARIVEEDVELKVYTSFPFASLGIGQTAKLLVALYVNGEKVPIEGCAIGNRNPAVMNLVDIQESEGVQVFTFETHQQGTADILFTEERTGATASITLQVEEKTSHYRCSNFPIPDASCCPIFVSDFRCTEHDDGTHTVSFRAYNLSYAYGTAAVYGEDGKFIRCVPINPRSDGTGFEYIVNGFWQSWEQTQYFYNQIFADGSMDLYELDGHAMETEICLENLPQNAKLVITADPGLSEYVTLYTGMDILLKYVFYTSNVDLKTSAYQDTLRDFAMAFLSSLPSNVAENVIQTLTTEISLAMVNGVNSKSVEKIYEAFGVAFGYLADSADEILTKALYSAGYAAADTVIISAVPLYSVVDFVNKVTAVSWPFVDYESNQGCGKMEVYCISHSSTNQLVNSNVTVTQKKDFGDDTVLDAYQVVSPEEVAALPVKLSADSGKYAVYSITLRDSGKEIQPEGKLTVRLPIPGGVAAENCAVYAVEPEGTVTRLPSEVEGGFVTFETTHLSYYIVGEYDAPALPEPREEEEPGIALPLIPICIAVSVLAAATLLLILRGKRKTRRKAKKPAGRYAK